MPLIPAVFIAKPFGPMCSNSQRTGHRWSKNACVTADPASPTTGPVQELWSGRAAHTRPSITAITRWYWATCSKHVSQPLLGSRRRRPRPPTAPPYLRPGNFAKAVI